MNALRTERGSRVVAASGIVAVVLSFVYATQPGIAKAPLCETAVWGLLILLAFAGWGGVLDRLVFRDRSADFGLRAVWGASVVLFVGAIFATASLFSRTVDVILVDVGLVGFAALLYVERQRNTNSLLMACRVVRRNGPLSVLVAVVLLAAVACYLGAIADSTTNAYDDDVAYLAFVRKLIETGTLIEPFSFRRMSALGGQTVFQSLLIPHASYQQLNTFDRGICVLLVVTLILGHRAGRRRMPLALTALVLGFFLTLPNNSINTAPHFAGFAFFLGMFRTMVFVREEDGVSSKAVVLALVAIATCTLRQNYLSVAVLTLGVSYAYRVLGKRGGATFRERLREPLLVCAVSVVLLLPWLILAYRSNQSILFPLQNGTFRKALALQSPTATLINELGLLVSMTLDNEPIKVLGILVLVGALVPDDHPYKPLRAFWISSALSLIILWQSFTLSTHGNLSRYLFGSVAALAAAVLLSVGTRRFAGRGSSHARAVLALAVGALLLQYTASREKASKTYQTYLDNVERERRRPPTSIETLPHEVFVYAHVQSFVPAGERMVAMVDATYLLDYARNPIFNLDMPGFSSLKPDMPFFQGSEKVAEYFLAHGMRYAVYVRPEFSQALYQRKLWFARMYNEEELWRLFSPYMVDVIDTFTQLRESRRNVYEEAGIVVLDLATRR